MVDNFHLLLKGQLGGVPAWSLELSASLNQTLRGGCVNEGFCYCYCLLCNICLLKRSGIGIANLVEGDVGQVVGQSSLSYVFEFAFLIVIGCLSIFFQFLLLFLLLLTFFSGLWFGKFSSFPSLEYETVLTGWLAGFHFPEKVKGVFTFQRKWKCNCFCVICVSAWGRKYLINVSKLLPASTDMKSKNIYFTEHGIFTLPNFVSNCKTASFTMFC